MKGEYRISELAAQVKLSRTALLYYEKQGLIKGTRRSNGYRVYKDSDVQRVRLLQQLQLGGFTLAECKTCLDAKIDPELLTKRLALLDKEIAQKQQARDLLAALLGNGSLRLWHQTVDTLAPDAHLAWLKQQGFNKKEAFHLKWLSKDMNEHQSYMTDFMKVFEKVELWGPGSKKDSLQAFSLLPKIPTSIIDIGCGKGVSTITLAEHSQAQITAVDNEPNALELLRLRAEKMGLTSRIKIECACMTDLPFSKGRFDLVWAEGAAYIMGVERALKQWTSLLEKDGMMVISDLVWLTDRPTQELKDFWKGEYQDMQTVATRIAQINQAGFELLSHFTLSRQAWEDYYLPLKVALAEVYLEIPDSAALNAMSREMAIYDQYLGQFGYEMFILRKR